jgi:hypothetical protein
MRHLKIHIAMAAVMVLVVLMVLAGCGDDRGNRFRDDNDRRPVRYEQRDNDRPDGDRRDNDRTEDRGREPIRDGDRDGDR